LMRGLMSDEEWSSLVPFLIERGARSGRRPRNHRLVPEGIFWIARTGVAWRDLHEHVGKWSSVYRQFRRWALPGLTDGDRGAVCVCDSRQGAGTPKKRAQVSAALA